MASTSSKLTAKKKKTNRSSMEDEMNKPKKSKRLNTGKKKLEEANKSLSWGREIIAFVKAENKTSLGLDESTMIADWDLLPDEPKKRQMESMFNKLYAMKLDLCGNKMGLVSEFTNVILKSNNASSSSSSSEHVPILSQNETVAEKNNIAIDVDKETCNVASGSGSKNGEKEKDTFLESTDRKLDQVSALKQIDPKESQEEKDEANKESENEASVSVAAIVKEDSRVASGRTEQGSGSNPRKKLLVLDLNGLLANVVNAHPGIKADRVFGLKAIFKRPFCEDFLNFCFEKFEVGIWSSRNRNNVERITEFLLGDMRRKLLFCWDMSYCDQTTTGSLENRYKNVVFKNLNWLWKNHDQELPWKKGDYNETNTVLLDDSPYKALLNPPYTAIFPHSYDHHNKRDASLGRGGDLKLYLEKLAGAENVQEFIKKNPFGQEAITKGTEHWEFYKKVVAQVRN